MDWPKFIADLFAAAVGGLIGGTLGAYYKSYWAEKGKNLATYEDIQTLLAQERGKAYEQEKGKRFATHEDIQNVLKEVQAVTRETETIKAQIGSDLWTRQKVWEQKREAYAKVLAISHDLRECLIDISKDVDKPNSKSNPKFAVLWNRYFYELAPLLRREIDVAVIFSGSEGGIVLQEFRLWDSTESETEFQTRVDFVNTWRIRLIEAARKDLRVPEL